MISPFAFISFYRHSGLDCFSFFLQLVCLVYLVLLRTFYPTPAFFLGLHLYLPSVHALYLHLLNHVSLDAGFFLQCF